MPGGAPANVAVAAARLGLSSAFIGKVGEDPFGRRLAAVLEESGVDTRGMRYDPLARTTLNFITLPDPNIAEYLFYRHPGADMMLRAAELDRELLERAADPEEACRVQAGRGPALAVATLGPQGSLFARLAGALGGERTTIRTRLASLAEASLVAALRYANATGALAATKKGVIPALPSAAEVERFLSGARAKELDKSEPYDRVKESFYHKEEEV